MARIYGKIESLKSLKSELENNGITNFNSVKEIKNFLSNYDVEKQEILNSTSAKLEKEYLETYANLNLRTQNPTEIINIETKEIDNQISDLQTKIDFIKDKKTNFLKKISSSVKVYFLKIKLNSLEKNKTKKVVSLQNDISEKNKRDELFLEQYKTEKQNLIEKRADSEIKKIEYTRNVIENSKNLIAGAIGENLVVKEIKKLPDSYVLINDFNLSSYRPLYYKKYNQRIYSIQIDHLLISKAGIFIIETKNWSKASVNSIDMRSPIEQIERSNYALNAYISKNISLNEHHWGEQKVPIRNLIVMINNKPRGKFKYVSIKLLNELNNYIKYFEPVLTDKQFNRIINKLI